MDPNTIIENLGGTVKTAELCGLTKGAVSQWRKSGIPRGWLKFIEVARPDAIPVETEAAKPEGRDAA